MTVQLGTSVTDSITGITGVATARAEYLYGCVQVSITRVGTDGKPEDLWFDEQRLTSTPSATSGGPQSTPPARSTPR